MLEYLIDYSGLYLCIQGTFSQEELNEARERFIPVHTGNIIDNQSISKQQPVYPCAYREHVIITIKKHSESGLSLCIQGTFLNIPPPSGAGRFIPVHTGNISKLYKISDLRPVYPCAYREH